jgi:hypothetical protein
MRWPLGGIFELPTWFITITKKIDGIEQVESDQSMVWTQLVYAI